MFGTMLIIIENHMYFCIMLGSYDLYYLLTFCSCVLATFE
jgi:hypothetical protein